jgi:hypothetical protein
MTKRADYEIATYLGWCGVDITRRFKNREEYEKVREFLDKLVGTGGASVGNFYYIAEEQREAFERFMKELDR